NRESRFLEPENLERSATESLDRDPRADHEEIGSRAAECGRKVRSARVDRVNPHVEAEGEMRFGEPGRAAAVVDRLEPFEASGSLLLSFGTDPPPLPAH